MARHPTTTETVEIHSMFKFDVAAFLIAERVTTSRAVANRFGVTLPVARRALDALVMQGTATCTGNTRARKYALVETAAS